MSMTLIWRWIPIQALVGQLVGQRYQVLEYVESDDEHEVPRRQSALDRFVALKVFRTPCCAFPPGCAGSCAAAPTGGDALRPWVIANWRAVHRSRAHRGQNSRAAAFTRPLSLEEVIRIGVDVLTALEESHRLGILHRQIHPSCVY